MRNEINICNYFFAECCEPTKTLRSNFGKVTIEQTMNTYVSGQAFYQALLQLKIPMTGTNYHTCKFALKIKPAYENTVLFDSWTYAENRIIDIEIINEQFIN